MPSETSVRVFRDGSQWCVLHGADLQSGVAGFGDTPADALRAFASEVDLTEWPEFSESTLSVSETEDTNDGQ